MMNEKIELVKTNNEKEIYELLMLFKPNFPLWEQQVPDFHLWAKKLSEFSEFYVLNIDKTIAGVIAFYDNDTAKKIAYITILGILPDYQRKGYGSDLLCFAMKNMNEKGFKEVKLQVDIGNTALDFYKRFGFITVGKNTESFTLSRNFEETDGKDRS